MKIIKHIILLFVSILTLASCSKAEYSVVYYDINNNKYEVYQVQENYAFPKNVQLTNSQDKEYYYKFLGWDYTKDGKVDELPDIVDKNYELLPVFEYQKKEYHIRLYSSKNKEELLYDIVTNYGEDINLNKYPHDNYSENEIEYTFIGWDVNGDYKVDSNLFVLTDVDAFPVFVEKHLLKSVRYFADETKEKLLFIDYVEYGNKSIYNGELPVKESDNIYNYVFKSWSQNLDDIRNNVDVYAEYESVYREYSHTFYDHKNEVWKIETGHYEDKKNYTYKLENYFDGESDCKFMGWDINGDNIVDELPDLMVENLEIHPVYEKTIREYRLNIYYNSQHPVEFHDYNANSIIDLTKYYEIGKEYIVLDGVKYYDLKEYKITKELNLKVFPIDDSSTNPEETIKVSIQSIGLESNYEYILNPPYNSNLSEFIKYKNGYIFEGFYLDINGNNRVFEVPNNLKENLIIYAKYTKFLEGSILELLADDTYKLVKYEVKEKNLFIPSTVNNKPITCIGSYLLGYNFYDYTSIHLPDNLNKIESLAFTSRQNIKEIWINKCLEIENRAIDSSNTLICIMAKECENGWSSNWNSDNPYIIDANNAKIDIYGNEYVLVDDVEYIINDNKLSIYNAYVTEPNMFKSFVLIGDQKYRITSIESYALRGKVTSINLPNSLSEIKSLGLSKLSELRFIEIDKYISSIDSYAFPSGCKIMVLGREKNEISFAPNWDNGCSVFYYDLVYYEDEILYGVKNGFADILKSYNNEINELSINTIHDYPISRILENAFGYAKINTLQIGENVKTILYNAFSNSDISSLKIYSKKVEVYSNSFNNSNINGNYIGDSDIEYVDTVLYKYNSNETEISLPEDIYVIANEAFGSLSQNNLKVINVGNVETIGSYAFDNFTVLESVIGSNVKIIYDHAFQNNSKLNQFDFSKVHIVEQYAFSNCSSLTSLQFNSSSNLYIGECAFENCTNVTILDIACDVDVLDNYCFENLGIKNLNFRTNIKEIRTGAFYGNKNLEEVVFDDFDYKIIKPNYKTIIGKRVFLNCSALTKLRLGNRIDYIGSRAIEGTPNLKSIFIPKNLTYLEYDAINVSNITINIESFADKTTWDYHCFNGNNITKKYGQVFEDVTYITGIACDNGDFIDEIEAGTYYDYSKNKLKVFTNNGNSFYYINTNINMYIGNKLNLNVTTSGYQKLTILYCGYTIDLNVYVFIPKVDISIKNSHTDLNLYVNDKLVLSSSTQNKNITVSYNDIIRVEAKPKQGYEFSHFEFFTEFDKRQTVMPNYTFVMCNRNLTIKVVSTLINTNKPVISRIYKNGKDHIRIYDFSQNGLNKDQILKQINIKTPDGKILDSNNIININGVGSEQITLNFINAKEYEIYNIELGNDLGFSNGINEIIKLMNVRIVDADKNIYSHAEFGDIVYVPNGILEKDEFEAVTKEKFLEIDATDDNINAFINPKIKEFIVFRHIDDKENTLAYHVSKITNADFNQTKDKIIIEYRNINKDEIDTYSNLIFKNFELSLHCFNPTNNDPLSEPSLKVYSLSENPKILDEIPEVKEYISAYAVTIGEYLYDNKLKFNDALDCVTKPVAIAQAIDKLLSGIKIALETTDEDSDGANEYNIYIGYLNTESVSEEFISKTLKEIVNGLDLQHLNEIKDIAIPIIGEMINSEDDSEDSNSIVSIEYMHSLIVSFSVMLSFEMANLNYDIHNKDINLNFETTFKMRTNMQLYITQDKTIKDNNTGDVIKVEKTNGINNLSSQLRNAVVQLKSGNHTNTFNELLSQLEDLEANVIHGETIEFGIKGIIAPISIYFNIQPSFDFSYKAMMFINFSYDYCANITISNNRSHIDVIKNNVNIYGAVIGKIEFTPALKLSLGIGIVGIEDMLNVHLDLDLSAPVVFDIIFVSNCDSNKIKLVYQDIQDNNKLFLTYIVNVNGTKNLLIKYIKAINNKYYEGEFNVDDSNGKIKLEYKNGHNFMSKDNDVYFNAIDYDLSSGSYFVQIYDCGTIIQFNTKSIMPSNTQLDNLYLQNYVLLYDKNSINFKIELKFNRQNQVSITINNSKSILLSFYLDNNNIIIDGKNDLNVDNNVKLSNIKFNLDTYNLVGDLSYTSNNIKYNEMVSINPKTELNLDNLSSLSNSIFTVFNLSVSFNTRITLEYVYLLEEHSFNLGEKSLNIVEIDYGNTYISSFINKEEKILIDDVKNKDYYTLEKDNSMTAGYITINIDRYIKENHDFNYLYGRLFDINNRTIMESNVKFDDILRISNGVNMYVYYKDLKGNFRRLKTIGNEKDEYCYSSLEVLLGNLGDDCCFYANDLIYFDNRYCANEIEFMVKYEFKAKINYFENSQFYNNDNPNCSLLSDLTKTFYITYERKNSDFESDISVDVSVNMTDGNAIINYPTENIIIDATYSTYDNNPNKAKKEQKIFTNDGVQNTYFNSVPARGKLIFNIKLPEGCELDYINLISASETIKDIKIELNDDTYTVTYTKEELPRSNVLIEVYYKEMTFDVIIKSPCRYFVSSTNVKRNDVLKFALDYDVNKYIDNTITYYYYEYGAETNKISGTINNFNYEIQPNVSKEIYISIKLKLNPDYIDSKSFSFILNSNNHYSVYSYDGDLSNIKIPDTYNGIIVDEILSKAFKNNIDNIYINKNIKNIQSNAFNCEVGNFIVNNDLYSVMDGNLVKGNKLIKAKKSTDGIYRLPDTIVELEDYAILGNNLTNIILNSQLETISGLSFYNLDKVIIDCNNNSNFIFENNALKSKNKEITYKIVNNGQKNIYINTKYVCDYAIDNINDFNLYFDENIVSFDELITTNINFIKMIIILNPNYNFNNLKFNEKTKIYLSTIKISDEAKEVYNNIFSKDEWYIYDGKVYYLNKGKITLSDNVKPFIRNMEQIGTEGEIIVIDLIPGYKIYELFYQVEGQLEKKYKLDKLEFIMPSENIYIDGIIYKDTNAKEISYSNNEDGTISIDKIVYDRSDTLIVPAYYEGKKVVQINSNAYSGNAMNIELPDTLNVIEDNAFINYYGSKTIFIPKSVIYVGHNSFKEFRGNLVVFNENVDFATDACGYKTILHLMLNKKTNVNYTSKITYYKNEWSYNGNLSYEYKPYQLVIYQNYTKNSDLVLNDIVFENSEVDLSKYLNILNNKINSRNYKLSSIVFKADKSYYEYLILNNNNYNLDDLIKNGILYYSKDSEKLYETFNMIQSNLHININFDIDYESNSKIFEYDEDLNGNLYIKGYNGIDTSISLPRTVNNRPIYGIRNMSFAGKSINSISIPSTYINIEGGALYGILGLNNIEIIEYDGVNSNYIVKNHALLQSTGNGQFTNLINYFGDNLDEIIKEMTIISDYAVVGQHNLRSLDLSNISIVGAYAFMGCSKLENIIIGQNTIFNTKSFYGCVNLKTFVSHNSRYYVKDNVVYDLDNNQKNVILIPSNSQEEVVTIDEDTISIKDYAGLSIKDINKLRIPAKCQISEYSFYSCENILIEIYNESTDSEVIELKNQIEKNNNVFIISKNFNDYIYHKGMVYLKDGTQNLTLVYASDKFLGETLEITNKVLINGVNYNLTLVKNSAFNSYDSYSVKNIKISLVEIERNALSKMNIYINEAGEVREVNFNVDDNIDLVNKNMTYYI